MNITYIMFETYVINLKKDIKNFYELEKKLIPKGIYPERFDAVYGKEIKNFDPYNRHITNFCKIFCPRGLIGCGLSHYLLLEQIYNQYQLKTNSSEFSLVLEDDATPLFKNKKTIEAIIKKMPKDCDILLLFCQGQCYNNSEKYIKHKSEAIGSTAAYLIRNSSIPKFLSKKLYTHVDMQWYGSDSNNVYVYNDKNLFSVDNSTSYNLDGKDKKNIIMSTLDKYIELDNFTFSQSLSYKVFRIPIIGIELTTYDIIVGLIFIIIVVILFIYKDRIRNMF